MNLHLQMNPLTHITGLLTVITVTLGMITPLSQASTAESDNPTPVHKLIITGTVVQVAQGNFWGIVDDRGQRYHPGLLPKEFQQTDLKVQIEARLSKKRPVQMWGKAIEIVRIEKQALSPDPHAQHRSLAAGFTRSLHAYRVPEVEVIQMNGTGINTRSLFNTNKAVIVSFIFTSCSAICPILTTTLAQTQEQLGPEADNLRIVSISIDPTYDSPQRLQDYAQRFKAQGDWRFLTGEPTAILALQQAFDVDRGDKNNHAPIALIRPAGQSQWVRLEGFTSVETLVKELRTAPGG
ncbi:MAG: SCO family protein [Gammaproteobacteria bacterium]|nr:SCO family protein [Gammaproteobacteria bacterium]